MAVERTGEIYAPISLDEKQWEVFACLHRGIRNPEDPVTWRTLVVNLRQLLGVEDSDSNIPSPERFGDACGLVEALVNTDLKPLVPEILCALGFEGMVEATTEGLDALLFNGRHFPEPLLFTIADTLRSEGRSVAVVNPVGHYRDEETRIVGPHISRPIDHLVIVASTQSKQGGSLEVLSKVIRTIRNPDFACNIGEVDVVIPMFGGSRGHRLGQDERVGYEALEAVANPKLLALTTRDILEQLRGEVGENVPQVCFVTVDIHDEELPGSIFETEGFKFISADPVPEFADTIYQEIKKRGALHFPFHVVACDKGAVPRTERMVMALLTHPEDTLKSVDMLTIDKTRRTAGIVFDAKIFGVERWKLTSDGIVVREPLPVPTLTVPFQEKCNLVVSDDMFDSGGTAEKDMELLDMHYPKARLRIFCATHPVLSKGPRVLDEIGADVYLFGNTLKQPELYGRKDVRIVDMAPAIVRAILGE